MSETVSLNLISYTIVLQPICIPIVFLLHSYIGHNYVKF